jgi:hypothetical protein
VKLTKRRTWSEGKWRSTKNQKYLKKFVVDNTAVFLKTPNFSVMQKPFKKCVFLMKVTWFLRSRKKLIRRFQKKWQNKLTKMKFIFNKVNL